MGISREKGGKGLGLSDSDESGIGEPTGADGGNMVVNPGGGAMTFDEAMAYEEQVWAEYYAGVEGETMDDVPKGSSESPGLTEMSKDDREIVEREQGVLWRA
jgi:hypothetical protein